MVFDLLFVMIMEDLVVICYWVNKKYFSDHLYCNDKCVIKRFKVLYLSLKI